MEAVWLGLVWTDVIPFTVESVVNPVVEPFDSPVDVSLFVEEVAVVIVGSASDSVVTDDSTISSARLIGTVSKQAAATAQTDREATTTRSIGLR